MADVTLEDFNKLKATFQQKETEANKQLEALKAKLKEKDDELAALKDISEADPADKRRVTLREKELADLQKKLDSERFELTLDRAATGKGIDRAKLLEKVNALGEHERTPMVIETLADGMRMATEIDKLKGSGGRGAGPSGAMTSDNLDALSPTKKIQAGIERGDLDSLIHK